jgi:rare lipoprotein A
MEQQPAEPTQRDSDQGAIGAPPGFCSGLICVALLLLVSGCSTYRAQTIPSASFYSSAPLPSGTGSSSRVVTASWYGNELKGHRTSSGEIYNPNGLTAASRSLPIGSHVAVTNVSSGRTVVVRINDRGPYVSGRSIDLSHAAAERIGLARKGVGRVEISRPEEAPSGAFSRVSYTPTTSSLTSARWWSSESQSSATHRVRYRRYHHTRARRRMVRNPIEHWLMSALPRF